MKEITANTSVNETYYSKDLKKRLCYKCCYFQIEELYSEVLYEVIHTVGCMAESGEQEVLFHYLQKAFRLDPERHDVLFKQAQSKEVLLLIWYLE